MKIAKCLKLSSPVLVFFLLIPCFAFALNGPSSEDSVVLLGKVSIKFDNYQGIKDTIKYGIAVIINRTVDTPTKQDNSYEASTDSEGYFIIENLPAEGSYSYKEVKLGNANLKFSRAIFLYFAME